MVTAGAVLGSALVGAVLGHVVVRLVYTVRLWRAQRRFATRMEAGNRDRARLLAEALEQEVGRALHGDEEGDRVVRDGVVYGESPLVTASRTMLRALCPPCRQGAHTWCVQTAVDGGPCRCRCGGARS